MLTDQRFPMSCRTEVIKLVAAEGCSKRKKPCLANKTFSVIKCRLKSTQKGAVIESYKLARKWPKTKDLELSPVRY